MCVQEKGKRCNWKGSLLSEKCESL